MSVCVCAVVFCVYVCLCSCANESLKISVHVCDFMASDFWQQDICREGHPIPGRMCAASRVVARDLLEKTVSRWLRWSPEVSVVTARCFSDGFATTAWQVRTKGPNAKVLNSFWTQVCTISSSSWLQQPILFLTEFSYQPITFYANNWSKTSGDDSNTSKICQGQWPSWIWWCQTPRSVANKHRSTHSNLAYVHHENFLDFLH